MLECRNWKPYDIGHEQGYQTGYQTAKLAVMVRLLRTKKITDPVDIFAEYCKMSKITEEQLKDFTGFCACYPYLPPEELAVRIMMESEYIYGLYEN